MWLLDVKIFRFVPVRVLKSKMTTVRIMVVPLRVLSQTNVTEYVLCCLQLVPLRGKNIFEAHLSNKILSPSRVFFKNFR